MMNWGQGQLSQREEDSYIQMDLDGAGSGSQRANEGKGYYIPLQLKKDVGAGRAGLETSRFMLGPACYPHGQMPSYYSNDRGKQSRPL